MDPLVHDRRWAVSLLDTVGSATAGQSALSRAPPPFFRPPDQVKAWEDDGRLKAREEQGRQAEQVLSIMHGDVPPVQLTKVLNDHQTTWCMITPNHVGEGFNL